MIVLHITDIKKPYGNGVAEAVKQYVKHEQPLCDVALYSLNKNLENTGTKEFNCKEYSNILSLPKPYNNPDLVVFNEVYKKKYLELYKECLKNNIPYVIIPHGCLVDVAQKNRYLKKTIGNILFFNRFIKKASAIQFLTEKEKNDTCFKYRKSIVSGNGVDIPKVKALSPENNDLIYIGRYAIYHKGLDMLIDVCKKNKEWFLENNIKIQLYGRPTREDLKKLNNLIAEKEVGDVVVVNGPIYGEDKIDLLRKSYGFIQISRHEGQPMGIIEALAYGLPCIVTEGTNFKDFINENNCGYGVDFDGKQIMDAVKNYYSNKKQRDEMSVNASKSAAGFFGWDDIMSKLLSGYSDLIEEEKRQ